MSAADLNADPTAKSKKGKDKATYEAEKARIARAAVELELEAIDATPERLKLFKRMAADGACKCDACCKRRLWIAIRRVDKKQEELDMLDGMDNMVANAYQGETEAVIEGLKKFGMAGVFHQGGPIAVTGCEECKHAPAEEPCYHCGRAGWMPSKKELIISRKDLKTMPAYFVMPVLHAACWGGNVLLAMKLIKMGCPVSEQVILRRPARIELGKMSYIYTLIYTMTTCGIRRFTGSHSTGKLIIYQYTNIQSTF